MALLYHLVQYLTIASAISGHLAQMIDSDWNNPAAQPPVYVIRDEPQVSSSVDHKWNNQNLAARQPSGPEADSAADSWTDQVGPYYHSYKFLGYNLDSSFGSNKQATVHEEVEHYHVGKTNQNAQRAGTKNGARNQQASPGAKKPELAQAPANRRLPLAPSSTNTTRRNQPIGKKNLVCYYGTWAVYRPDAGKYPVENIDPFLCTHIIYGFTGLSFDNKIKPLDPYNDLEDNYGKGAMKRFTNLKRINPDLKTLVAIGGWNEGSIKYSRMAADPEARAKFVRSVVDFLGRYNFDGLDLDWEYPGSRGGSGQDKGNYVKLLRELKQAFQPRGYLLTAAVSAGKWFMDAAYDIGQVSRYLDLINLMAYDYHGGWEPKTGMNAPLFHSKKHDSSREEMMLNVNWSVNYWLAHGAPKEKLMLGVGSYGRSFTLDRANQNGINAPANQKGQAGPYTREPGSLGYNEICESFQRGGWTIVRDPDYLAPYAYNGRQWVGYDDRESLALKAQYAKSMGLGGMMMWSIETDDFQGRCHGEKYPLLNTIRRVMASNSGGPPVKPTPSGRPVTPTKPPGLEVEEDERPAAGSSTTSTTTTTTRRPIKTTTRTPGTTRRPTLAPTRPTRPTRPTTTSTTTTTTKPTTSTTTIAPTNGGEFSCRSEGMFADPSNCRRFIRCVIGSSGQYTLYRFDCGPGTAFSAEQQVCDHLYNVPTCANNYKKKQLQLITRPTESF